MGRGVEWRTPVSLPLDGSVLLSGAPSSLPLEGKVPPKGADEVSPRSGVKRPRPARSRRRGYFTLRRELLLSAVTKVAKSTA